jgi:hypothetical protein
MQGTIRSHIQVSGCKKGGDVTPRLSQFSSPREYWPSSHVWARRRELQRITNVCPFWLSKADGPGYDLKPDAEWIIHRLFREAHYLGLDKITARLNAERIPPFVAFNRRGKQQQLRRDDGENIWHASLIHRILTGRAVCGEQLTDKPNRVALLTGAMPRPSSRRIMRLHRRLVQPQKGVPSRLLRRLGGLVRLVCLLPGLCFSLGSGRLRGKPSLSGSSSAPCCG